MRLLAPIALIVATAASPFTCPAGAVPKPADLTGTLWWLAPTESEPGASFLTEELDAMKALGMHRIILNGPYVDAPGLGRVLDAAAARGMTIFIDTLSAANWWTLADPTDEIQRACDRIDRLHKLYGTHPAFEGWYIPYELYMFWDKEADLIARLYGGIAAHCKTTDATKRVMISPFFILDQGGSLGTFRWAEPAEYQAFWTTVLKRAPGIDIVALQDSGEHLSFYTMQDRQPFFEAMKAACGEAGVTLWANIETAELEVASFEEYETRFGRGTHVNDPSLEQYWRGVPAERLQAKRNFAGQFTNTAITWGYRERIRPSLGPEATALYSAYRAVLIQDVSTP